MVVVAKKQISAFPPWHSIAFVAGTLAWCIHHLPTLQSLDEIANNETLLNVVFPEYLTALQVGVIRVLFGLIMLGDSIYQFIFGYWDHVTEYAPESQLQPVKIPFRGVYYSGSVFRGSLTLSYFTFWAWVLEGITFLIIGGIPIWIQVWNVEPSPWIYRFGIAFWEISAPASMLVSVVVKYILWSLALRSGNETNLNLLRHPMTLVEHNFNFIACIVEVTLLGGLPIRYIDVPFTLLFGLLYVLFSYWAREYWIDPCHGPQFLYPFFDTTIGRQHTASLLGLLLSLSLFHVLFCWLDHFLIETLRGGLLNHVIAIAVLTFLVCRFRD
ncbi:hypothetical protein ACA910_017086 [Epithemia clementina (nom. ined.)]